MAGTVHELKGVAIKLRAAVDAQPAQEPTSARPRSEEMAEALAAAVERLRARAQESAVEQAETTPAGTAEILVQAPLAAPAAIPVAPPEQRAPHKHSMSLIGRWRLRRKQRRGR